MTARKKLIPLAVLFLALAVRLVALHCYCTGFPLHRHLLADDGWYVDKAQSIISAGLDGERVFSRSPLFPLLVAMLLKAFAGSATAIRIILVCIDSFTPLLLYAIGRRLDGDRLGLLCGVFYALFFPAVFFSFQILPAAPAAMMLTLAVWLLAAGCQTSRLTRVAGSGVCLGAAALLKPLLIGLFPVWIAASVVLFTRGGRRLAAGLIFCLGLGAAVLPVTLYNYLAEGSLVLISSQGGINFFIGNNPEANGTSPVAFTDKAYGQEVDDGLMVLHSARELAEQHHGREISSSEVSGYWYRRAFHWIRGNPLDFSRLFCYKVYLFLQSRELPNNFEPRFFFSASHPPGCFLLDFRVLTPLFLLGLLLVPRRNVWFFLLLNGAAYIGLTALFFVCSRYRVVAAPFLIPVASWTLIYWFRHRPNRVKAVLIPILAIGLGLLVTVDFFHLERDLSQLMRLRVVDSYALEDRWDQARELLRRILEKNRRQNYQLLKLDTDLRCYLARGKIERACGNLPEAAGHFEQTVRLAPDTLFSTEPLFHLGEVYFQLGRYEDSARALRKILRIRPGHMPALLELVQVMAAGGKWEAACRVSSEINRWVSNRILLNCFCYAGRSREAGAFTGVAE